MSSLSSATTIIMAEAIIILIGLMAYLAFRYLRHNRDIMSAIKNLANKIRGNKDSRLNTLHDFLMQTCRYDDETANTTAAALVEKERLFYSCLMEIYLNRDHDALANLDTKTEEIISAYRGLLTVSVKAIAAESELDLEVRTQQLSKTIDDLNDKNKTLGTEISQLKNDMDVTIEEYSSAFRNQAVDTEEDSDATTADTEASTETEAEAEAEIEIEIETETETSAVTALTTDATTEKTPDDSVEPEFHNRGINTPETTITTPADSDNNNEADNASVNADLEALAAELDAESEQDETNPSIPLDGLDDLDLNLDGLDEKPNENKDK